MQASRLGVKATTYLDRVARCVLLTPGTVLRSPNRRCFPWPPQ